MSRKASPDRAGVLPLSPGPRRILHGPEVERCLDEVRASRRRTGLLEGIALFTAAAAGGTVLLFALDNAMRLGPPARMAMLAGFGVVLLFLLLKDVLVRPFRPLSDEECAILYEEAHPGAANRVINTVLFDRREFAGLEAQAVRQVREEAQAAVAGGASRAPGGLRRAARLGAAALAAVAVLAAYRMLLPDRFGNALARFARPGTHVAPLAKTALRVLPGHAAIRPLERLRVTAEVSGTLPESASILLSFGAAPVMRFDGRSFIFDVEGRTEDFRYRVVAGDAESEEFAVRVRRLPAVDSLELVVRAPEYTRLPPKVEPAGAEVQVIAGSGVEIRLRSTKPLARATFLVRDGEPLELARTGARDAAAAIIVEKDLAYDFRLEDEEGEESPPPSFSRRLVAAADLPPRVEVTRPGRDLAVAPGEGIPVALRIEDDVGLRDAALEVCAVTPPLRAPREGGRLVPGAGDQEGPWKVAVSFDGLRGSRSASPAAFLAPARLGIRPGSGFLYRARATDLKGQTVATRSYEARVLDRAEAAARERDALSRARPGLDDLLRRERALRARTADAKAAATGLAGEQEEIIAVGREVFLAWEGGVEGETRRALARALSDPLPRAARALERAASSAGGGTAAAPLAEALREEDRAIALLEAVLRRVNAALASLARGELPGPQESPENRLRGESREMREVLDRLEKFAAEQRKVIEGTKALEGKAAEDFTAGEVKSLDELAAAEERWAKALRDLKDDISKVSPQDFSVGNQVKELVEVVEEVDLAKDYLQAKDVELAVPKEQSGLELAEKIENNIERWLSRSRDNLKWLMEEPTEEADVPLQDLPAEMTDIVGDLIDREDLMTAETEDAGSSWLDSMDAGVGWDAMDGPISDMSAKGVTGNLQPNDMEIGGRSGEGRSGRSMGQFVEEAATGKGGRPTPGRSTADPFESGEVKDSSRDPVSAATGGGKLAGAGEEGLRGAPSPDLGRRLGPMADAQARIRGEAERLDHVLRRRRYFSGDLERTIELMGRLEKELRDGRADRFVARRREIVSGLRGLEASLGSALERDLESPPALPKDLRDELLNSGGEEMPREFGDAIRDYYRSLAEPPGRPPPAPTAPAPAPAEGSGR